MYPFAASLSLVQELDAPAPTTFVDAEMASHDMRDLGLEGASDRLRMQVADLGVVLEARARADVAYCPVCPRPHPR